MVLSRLFATIGRGGAFPTVCLSLRLSVGGAWTETERSADRSAPAGTPGTVSKGLGKHRARGGGSASGAIDCPAMPMKMRLAVFLGIGVVMLTLSVSALGDVVPPPDYVETCTVAKAQRTDEQCVDCGDSYHAEPNACAERYGAEGYRRRCRTSGASVWSEIWCRPAVAQRPSDGPGPFASPPPDDSAAPANEVAASPEPSPGSDDTDAMPVQRPSPAPPFPKSGACGACVTRPGSSSWLSGALLLGVAVLLWRRRV
jgi:hypothetical protein